MVEIEQAFKELEDLAIRPIYHQTDARIEAHIFVAFLAYCLQVTLKQRLRSLAPGLTPRSMLDKMAAIQMVDLHLPTTDGRTMLLSRYTEPEPDQLLLLRRLKMELPAQPPPRVASADVAGQRGPHRLWCRPSDGDPRKFARLGDFGRRVAKVGLAWLRDRDRRHSLALAEGNGLPSMNVSRRLFAATEALAQGRGGVSATAIATGLARSTINRGIQELRSGRNELGPRLRRRGAGRKSAVTQQPGLPAALEKLVEGAIRGDPCSPLRWVSRSQRHIVKELTALGFKVSQRVVGKLLRELGYSCQANCKTREGSSHPDRNAQFEHVNATVQAAIAAGEPAISVDTKKKELVGDFKNNGRELRPKGDPEPVRVHDFKIPELGKVAPYGVYDIAANHGWVSVGIDADTGASPSRASGDGGTSWASRAIPTRPA